jgi:xanthine dehydrogenase iron-sulfur cluster and FAD-binding subunit A
MFRAQKVLGLRTKQSSVTLEKVFFVPAVAEVLVVVVRGLGTAAGVVAVAVVDTAGAVPELGRLLLIFGADQVCYRGLFLGLIRNPW